MRATDATQIPTAADGKVWLLGVVEHWNAEMLGWHVTKRGTRYEAIPAIGMAVRRQFGHLGAGAARGLGRCATTTAAPSWPTSSSSGSGSGA